MTKYSFELKKEIVQAYHDGEGGYIYLAKKYGIKSKNQVGIWVHSYNTFGDEGLMPSTKNKKYSFEFKLHVVELYLANKGSCLQLALANGINSTSLVTKWVIDFKRAGTDGLRPQKKGRTEPMNLEKKKKQKQAKPIAKAAPEKTSSEYVKQIEDQLLKLRIENAYLKKVRRLRLSSCLS